ncbi:MAG: ribonuclease H-like domain-containing protein [Candidatus Dormibacteria bacterium]
MSAAPSWPASPDRVATLAALRERMAALGGMPGNGLVARRPAAHPARRVPEPGRLGFEAEATAEGTAWVRRVRVDLGPFLERAGAVPPVLPRQLVALGCRRGAPVDAAGGWPDSSVVVLDIESMGLRGSGVLAFLVGLGVPHGTHLDVEQLLVADPGEEAAMLTALLARVGGSRLLLTYNGRTFDIPMLGARLVINRLPRHALDERLHSDLLPPVRRLFRDRLGGCTLRQVEVGLLGMIREDDVPGYEAPGRYNAWLRGGASEVLAGVVRHNELDLCATAVLGARMAAHVEGHLVMPVEAADRYHLGVHHSTRGVREAAELHYRACFDAGANPRRRDAGHRLGRLLSRARTAEAVEVYTRLVDADARDLRAARALAIALQREGRLDEALAVCSRAEASLAAMPQLVVGRLRGAPRGGWEHDWCRRRSRLESAHARAARPRTLSEERSASLRALSPPRTSAA